MTKDLLPCPFCGGEKLDATRCWVTCMDCNAFGPNATKDLTAVEIWNRRADVKKEVESHTTDK